MIFEIKKNDLNDSLIFLAVCLHNTTGLQTFDLNSVISYRKCRQYININISVSVSYRHFRYRLFRYIDIISTSEI